MLVDLDYFFAQAEEVRNPSIRDKPVVVCVYSGRTADSGAVSTANYLARKYGVKSGMPIFMAKSKLESVDSIFLPVDHEYYDAVSDRIMVLLRRYTDVFEQVGIDEAYLDVSHRVDEDFAKGELLAQQIKREITRTEHLTCSVGIGPNKLVAKIAADIRKPDGLTVVKPEQMREFLAPLPIGSLLGVGKKTEKRMLSLGIRTVGDLSRFDVQTLSSVFGKNGAAYFHNASMGIDEEPVKEAGETESISRIATLKENTRDLQVVVDKAYALCADVHSDVLKRGLVFRSVTVLAVMADMSVRNKSLSLGGGTSDIGVFKSTVKDLLSKLLKESDQPIRRVGVKIAQLSKTEVAQERLTKFLETP